MIRPAVASDRESLVRLGHSEAEVHRMFHGMSPFRHGGITLVWQSGAGELVGSASAGPIPGHRGFWISGFVRVAESAQGRGIGTALVRSVLGAAESAGARRVYCLIEPENTASIRIHERAGYRRAPAERSSLIRASGAAAPDEELRRGAPQVVDRKTFREAVEAAGYATSMEYFPGALAATDPPVHRRLLSAAAQVLRRARHRPIERRLIVRSADQLISGLILSTPAEPRLMTEREQVEQLSPPRLAALESKVARPYWPLDQEAGFLLLHDETSRPDPALVRKRLSVFTV